MALRRTAYRPAICIASRAVASDGAQRQAAPITARTVTAQLPVHVTKSRLFYDAMVPICRAEGADQNEMFAQGLVDVIDPAVTTRNGPNVSPACTTKLPPKLLLAVLRMMTLDAILVAIPRSLLVT